LHNETDPREIWRIKTFTDRPPRQWPDEDYDVFADDKVVGRISEKAPAGPPELRWAWSIAGIACDARTVATL
jgi:hypothetical protein